MVVLFLSHCCDYNKLVFSNLLEYLVPLVMELDLTPFQDDDQFDRNRLHPESRAADLVAVYDFLQERLFRPQGDRVLPVCSDLFARQRISSEDESESLLWSLVLSSTVKTIEIIFEKRLLEKMNVSKVSLLPRDFLMEVFIEEAEAVWNGFIEKSKCSLNELLDFLCKCHKRWLEIALPEEWECAADGLVQEMESEFLGVFKHEFLELIDGGVPSEMPSFWDYPDTRWNQWIKYLQKQQTEITENLPNELFSLEDIYIDLRGFFLKQDKEDLFNGDGEIVGVELASHIVSWAKLEDPDDTTMVISGHRGSGKSAFCRVFIARQGLELFKHSISTFHIPVSSLKRGESLSRSITNYFIQVACLGFDPLEASYLEDHKVLLILDGLGKHPFIDHQELEYGSDLLQEACDLCSCVNDGREQVKLKVVMTSHPSHIQANSSIWKDSSLVEVLPFVPDNIRERDFWPKNQRGDASEFLLVDQRKEWWKQWSQFVEVENPDDLMVLSSIEADHLAHWSFFNYAVTCARKKIDLTKDLTLQDVFQGILDFWLEECGLEDAVDREIFFLCLEELSVCLWNGDDIGHSASEIYRQLNESAHLKYFIEGNIGFSMAEGLHEVIQSCFKKGGPHASSIRFDKHLFGDYFVASRLVRVMKWLYEYGSFSANQRNSKCANVHEDLLIWSKMTAGVPMNMELFSFFRAILKATLSTCSEKEQKGWQNVFTSLLTYVVGNGVPMEEVEGFTTYQDMNKGAYHVETALIVALGGIAMVTKRVSMTEWKRSHPYALGSWLMRMNGQRSDYIHSSIECGLSEWTRPSFVLRSLAYLNIAHQTLTVQNLASASLVGAIFHEVNFNGSSLRYADLRFAHFNGCLMREVAADYANFQAATLDHIDLTGASMRGCRMYEASLIQARMRRADLSMTRFTGCTLSFAILDESLLEGALFDDASMNGVSMKSCHVNKASLLRCALDEVNAFEAIFHQCHLAGASMIHGMFNECSFSSTDLTRACFYHASFESASFLTCQMSGVNLESSNLSQALFRECDLSGSSFHDADLSGASFESGCSFHGASLNGVILNQTLFKGANLRRVTFEKAVFGDDNASSKVEFIECDLSDADFNEVHLQRVQMIETTLEGATFIHAVLKDSDFTGVNLKRAIFDRANLKEANLKDASLEESSLFQTDLRGAHFAGARLWRANLHGADMEGANCCGTDFSEASLFGASLIRADLRGAKLEGASLFGANLEGARLRTDQLTEEQRMQMRGTPHWVYDDELLGSSQGSSGTGLESLTILNVHETSVQVNETVVEVGDTMMREHTETSVEDSETVSVISSSVHNVQDTKD